LHQIVVLAEKCHGAVLEFLTDDALRRQTQPVPIEGERLVEIGSVLMLTDP